MPCSYQGEMVGMEVAKPQPFLDSEGATLAGVTVLYCTGAFPVSFIPEVPVFPGCHG